MEWIQREWTELLDTIALIHNRTETYHRYLQLKIKENLEPNPNSPNITLSTNNNNNNSSSNTSVKSLVFNVNFYEQSELSRAVQELMSHYVVIEEYYMIESIKKAVKMNELTPDGLTSSMIDYIFFILQKCTTRSLSTLDTNSVCAVLNIVTGTLTDLKSLLSLFLSESAKMNSFSNFFANNFSNISSGTSASDHHHLTSNIDFFIHLNNLDVASEFILRLKVNIETQASQFFQAPKDVEKIRSCLVELTSISKSFKSVLLSNLETIASSITPSLNHILKTFSAMDYNQSDADLYEGNGEVFVSKVYESV